MLTELQALLGGRVRDTWAAEMQQWGTLVRLYREYAEGRQRSFLTAKQRAALNIKTDVTEQIVLNYCDMVVQAMADRLSVSRIDGEGDEASNWSADLLKANRFDGLQMDVTEASVRDGVSFVMVAFDNAERRVVFAHEPAWDGACGLIPVYDRLGKTMIAAIKVWDEPNGKQVNLYLPDRVQKYTWVEGKLTLTSAPQWRDRSGQPLGVPVVAVPNRKNGRGISELAAVIPMQDTLNRSLIDMIMTSGLTAFQLKVALGFTPPDTVAPGDWVTIPEAPADQKVDAFVLPQGQLVPFIQQAQFVIDQIGTISRTPLPRFLGADTSSGEALKQREVGFLGKLKRYQVKGGNAWEDVIMLAARVQDAYGTRRAPASPTWDCIWDEPEVRNDTEVIDNALKVADRVGRKEFLRLIAPVYGWDETKIDEILAEQDADAARRLDRLRGSTGNFDAFDDAQDDERQPALAFAN
jgi:hypothetical protein